MGKTRGVHETTPELRNRMVGMYEAGLGLRDIAAAVNCSQRTVKRWLNRFDKEGTVETRERCGRKRATTSEQDEAIIRLATQTPITAAKAVLPALGLSCSVDTIRERLHKAGIHNWSPSRKHIQRIPLGSEGESTTIQQAVWRPTGTQLGKKKLVTKDTSNKNKKNGSSNAKKKQKSVKVRARDVYVGDGAPADAVKQAELSQDIVFIQQSLPQEQQPPPLPHENNDIQVSRDPLPNSQTEFSDPLCLVQTPQPQVYQHHPGLNVVQNWPLDLVQGSHHYPQGQPHSMSHEQPPPQQHLQELHTQREQQHRAQQQAHQQHMQGQVQQQQQLHSDQHHNHHHHHHHQHHHHHHHNLEQHQPQEHQMEQREIQTHRQIPCQPEHSVATRRPGKIIHSDRIIHSDSSNSVSSNEQMSDGDDLSKDDSREDCEDSSNNERRKKKKGGKAKGTLETSVEIRNRMIGMSEAGLSTLSIALAINRSERTVKRWLERWNKEGNVRTKERKGRRRITTKEQDDAIIAMATQHPLTAAKHVAPALGLNCSVDTIRERLHKAGIHSWKLGKKQGEGNAVHTVHLWQPSGNRPNKPKLPNEKRNKSLSGKKRVSSSGDGPRRLLRKKKAAVTESPQPKIVPPAANMIAEPDSMQFHDNGNLANYVPNSEMMHNLPTQQTQLIPSSAPGTQPPGPQNIQPLGPLMEQRPDCRMEPSIGPPVPGQNNNPSVAYSSCMVSSNGHVTHMEQPDPLNYEPYIWSF